LLIGFQDTAENVGEVFLGHSVIVVNIVVAVVVAFLSVCLLDQGDVFGWGNA